MPTCIDCHQGDNITMEKESAHQGVLKPFLMAVSSAYKGQATARTEIGTMPLEPSGQHVNDAFIVTGTRDDLPQNNKALLWIQMDKMSHALGEARSCASCHTSHAQVAESNFTFANNKDVQQPFTGSYTIIADAEGMRFENLKTSPIIPTAQRHIADFAPFTYFPDGWNVAGIDFSIPFRVQEVAKATTELEQFITELNEVKNLDMKTIRAVAYHNLEMARKMLANKKK
ncbi:MAG: hypothetical protein RBR06_06620 [Desulfuromonadaceae bacterium]|nr:hypothetical protein [Desulfuromonadaceae bacterium]